MNKTYWPSKDDFPDQLRVLNEINSKNYYHAIEASASAYFDSYFIISRLFYRRLEKVIQLIDKKDYGYSLDAGTGIGMMLPFLSKISRRVKAIDYTDIIEHSKAMAKKNGLDNISFEKNDVTTINTNQKFDLIVCLSVLEHIDNPNIVFENFKNMLSPDGILIVGYPIENWLIKTFRYIEGAFRKNISKKVLESSYRRTELFTGHVSDWKKIDNALEKHFDVNRKVNLSFCLLNYYAIRKIYNKSGGWNEK